VDDLASAVLEEGEGAPEVRAVALDDLRLSIKENVEVGQVALIEAATDNLIDAYLHRQDGRGVNGVVVEASGVDQEALHQIALHIAFAKPTVLSRDEVPPDLVEVERAALLDITKAEGKPEQAWDKIVEGRLSAWFRETVLLEQGLHGDKTTVQETLGEGRIVRFVQAYIGN
jgi:elongation factor Ts